MRSMKLTVLHDFYAILKTENWNIMIPNLIKPCCSRQTPHKIKRRAVEKFYRYLVVNAGSDPAGCDRPPPKTDESNFIHHDFVLFGKKRLRYKAVLPSIFCHSSIVNYTSSLLQ